MEQRQSIRLEVISRDTTRLLREVADLREDVADLRDGLSSLDTGLTETRTEILKAVNDGHATLLSASLQLGRND